MKNKIHIEEYITSVGKSFKNKNQNYEFLSISSLRKFIEDWEEIKNENKMENANNTKTEITSEDVYRVVNDLCIGITNEQVEQVIELYPSEQKEDKSATWNLVVEKIIWNLKD